MTDSQSEKILKQFSGEDSKFKNLEVLKKNCVAVDSSVFSKIIRFSLIVLEESVKIKIDLNLKKGSEEKALTKNTLESGSKLQLSSFRSYSKETAQSRSISESQE